jgi:signal transduction histidine kinase
LKSTPDKQNEEILSSVEIIKSEIRRLDRIISNFLTAVRPVKTEYKLSRINDILSEIVRFMDPEMHSLGIKANIVLDSKIPATLLDKNQIKQAFSNLIKNAIQAMPDGGKLTISSKKTDDSIRISFTDTGRGIPPELIKRIFEPYISSKVDGSGLGLMITDRIIHEHGGSIGISSAPQKGTTVTIDLPVLIQREVRMLPERDDKKSKPGRKSKK